MSTQEDDLNESVMRQLNMVGCLVAIEAPFSSAAKQVCSLSVSRLLLLLSRVLPLFVACALSLSHCYALALATSLFRQLGEGTRIEQIRRELGVGSMTKRRLQRMFLALDTLDVDEI